MSDAVPLARLATTLGVSEEAIRKGIRTGRLEHCLRRTPRGLVADVAIARREWTENRGEDKNPNGRPSDTSIAAARRRLLIAQAERAELERAIRAGQYVQARAAELRYTAEVVRVRTMLEGLPSRAKVRLPHLTTADLVTLSELVHEVCTELAKGDTDGEEAPPESEQAHEARARQSA